MTNSSQLSDRDLFDLPDDMEATIAAFPRHFRGQPPQVASWVMPGWGPLVRDLLSKIDAELRDDEAPYFHVVQVKEKFGALRFYMQAPESSMRARLVPFVRDAEKASERICDRCGQPGSRRNIDGWYTTLCDEHRADPKVTGYFGDT